MGKAAAGFPVAQRSTGEWRSVELNGNIGLDTPTVMEGEEETIPAGIPWLELPSGRKIPLTERCTIGRHPDCVVQLNSKRVSRWHAAIVRLSDTDFRLMDLDTLNGTVLNGNRIVEPTQLHNGDSITVGDFTMTYHAKRKRTGVPVALDQLDSTIGDSQAAINKPYDIFESCGHGIVVLEADHSIIAMTESVKQWIDRYFAEAETSAGSLPPEMIEWLEKSSPRNIGKGYVVGPFERRRGERRLVVRLKQDMAQRQTMLLFTEEEPLFTRESLVHELQQSFSLTPRESEVAFYVAAGKSNYAIGVILGNAERTVQKHVEAILTKLSVEDRQSVIVFIFEHFKKMPRDVGN